MVPFDIKIARKVDLANGSGQSGLGSIHTSSDEKRVVLNGLHNLQLLPGILRVGSKPG
jgi:hypothetical protein